MTGLKLNIKHICLHVIFLVITAESVRADSLFVFKSITNISSVSGIYCYEDASSGLSALQVIEKDSFIFKPQPVTNLGISNSSFWIKVTVRNESNAENLIFGIANPVLDEIDLYEADENAPRLIGTMGDKFPFSERIYNHQYFMFDISIPLGRTKTFLLRVKSWEQMVLPLFMGTPKEVLESNLSQDLIFGIFFGIMLSLVLYNLFIYFTVKDSSYLFYVTYIFLISITQACLNGYTLRFLLPGNPAAANAALIIVNSFAGLASIRFIQLFMDTKKYVPFLNKGYFIIGLIYAGGVISVIAGFKQVSYNLMDLGGFLISFFTLFIAIKISLKGSKPARLFLLAWSVFLIGVILFVLKNVGVLPANSYTNHLLTFGVATEGILLSIALATRINDYKKDKESSQLEAYHLLEEKKQIILNQNILLEEKVKERTLELNETVIHLKETQSQLVDAEKMASLGQLTAGISHEINNPINFVVSNIKPLKRDVQEILSILDKYAEIKEGTDLKEKLDEINALKKKLDSDYLRDEINQLLKGIDEGAHRTSEIVKGLKNFARADEGDLKRINIHEGIDATLTLLNNNITNNAIKIVKNYGALPDIECYPGKINQVLMNLFSNAIDALKTLKPESRERIISVETLVSQPNIIIKVSDNGIGIPANVIPKIFDPFYTTKDVGEGTGLGLSIVYGIIKSHNGKIEVQSEENKNTIFTITLPVQQ